MTDTSSESKDEPAAAPAEAGADPEHVASPEPELKTKAARVLNAQGRERPQFLLDFPDDPALSELVSAFERGDYARVREKAAKLAETTTNPAVRLAAEELRRRIEPDPLLKYLLASAVLLLLFLTVYAYHGHGH